MENLKIPNKMEILIKIVKKKQCLYKRINKIKNKEWFKLMVKFKFLKMKKIYKCKELFHGIFHVIIINNTC